MTPDTSISPLIGVRCHSVVEHIFQSNMRYEAPKWPQRHLLALTPIIMFLVTTYYCIMVNGHAQILNLSGLKIQGWKFLDL